MPPHPAIRLHRGDLPADYVSGPAIAIDTETLGLNPHRDRLCVVQISRGDGTADVVQIIPGGPAPETLMRVLADLGGVPVVRDKYRTDQGNLVADCNFPTLGDPHALAATLSAIPGVLGHGLFLDEVDAAYIASKGVVTRLERSGASA